MPFFIRILLMMVFFLPFYSSATGNFLIQSDVVNGINLDQLQAHGSTPQHKLATVSRNALQPDPRGLQKSSPEQIRLLEIMDSQMDLLQQMVDQEQSLMMNVVHGLSRADAEIWLASFISAKPLNCPVKKQKEWIEAIINGVENNQVPLNKEILALVACIISIESGFHADPLAIDPSRGEDMSMILERAERDISQKLGSLMSVPPIPHFYNLYKEKYYPMILACKTEGDVEVVAKRVVEDLKRDMAFLPDFMKSIVDKELDRVGNVIRTKGSMQLNFPRAIHVMRERGEAFTQDELRDYMYTINGGVDVGIAAIRPMFVQYAARYGTFGNRSWLFFVGMDYHYGPFSSRNMMEQIRIRDLSGREIPIDGDFLHYDDSGLPANKESETLKAVTLFFPKTDRSEIFQNFLLEKQPHYIYTNTHQKIMSYHQARFGPTPFAIIGDLWMGESAQIKHGATWKTQAYLKKLDKLLNSIPWEQANQF